MKIINKALTGLTVATLLFGLSACGSNERKAENMVDPNASSSGYYDQSINSGFEDSPQVAGSVGNDSGSISGAAKNVFYFGFNQDSLTAQARADLAVQAENLRGQSGTVRLEGHADELGSREYNMALSERRAKTVSQYLQAQGVSGSRIQVVAYGEEKPAVDGSSSRAHALNRRVELK